LCPPGACRSTPPLLRRAAGPWRLRWWHSDLGGRGFSASALASASSRSSVSTKARRREHAALAAGGAPVARARCPCAVRSSSTKGVGSYVRPCSATSARSWCRVSGHHRSKLSADPRINCRCASNQPLDRRCERARTTTEETREDSRAAATVLPERGARQRVPSAAGVRERETVPPGFQNEVKDPAAGLTFRGRGRPAIGTSDPARRKLLAGKSPRGRQERLRLLPFLRQPGLIRHRAIATES
jgi:hypothetical protein